MSTPLYAALSRPGPASFFNFTFLPKYATYFVNGVLNTLLLSIFSVLLAVIPPLLTGGAEGSWIELPVTDAEEG